MTLALPTLNKLTSSNKLQEWRISVKEPATIVVVFGQKDGKLQRTEEEIKQGKNIGKANETTPYEQAVSEAESRWKKKLDSGYFQEGHYSGMEMLSPTSLLPMLAQSYDKHAKKIEWPAYAQPKLDGCRMIASRVAGKVQLLSRKGKEFKAIPHINSQLENILPKDENGTVALDGELYVHGENFQDIISKIKRDDIHPLSTTVDYHIYDIFQPALPNWNYEERLAKIQVLNLTGNLKQVETLHIKNESELLAYHTKCTAEGYEGVMVRNINGYYINDKRSYDLQKVKVFQTEEFEIVGAEENRGRQAGQCSVLCKTASGNVFAVKPEGTEEQREEYWRLHLRGELAGQLLTVRFFEYTKDSDTPRFPIGVILRSYE